MSETIEVHGVEVSAHDVEMALDRLDDFKDGVSRFGDATVYGDGDNDDAVYVVNESKGEVAPTYIFADDLREKIDEAKEPDETITFVDQSGSEVTIRADADFEIQVTGGVNDFVAGFDEDAVEDGAPNNFGSASLDGDWEQNYYFVDLRLDQ